MTAVALTLGAVLVALASITVRDVVEARDWQNLWPPLFIGAVGLLGIWAVLA